MSGAESATSTLGSIYCSTHTADNTAGSRAQWKLADELVHGHASTVACAVRDFGSIFFAMCPSTEPAHGGAPPREAGVQTARMGHVFVGRSPELAELRAALEETLSGRGGLYLIAGEAGIGKTRLANEVAAQAAERGARVLRGRCWEGGGAPPFWPWVQVLRSCIRACDGETLEQWIGDRARYIAELVPELRERLPGLSKPPESSFEHEGRRFYLLDSTTAFLRNAAGRTPLVLLFDDLHAADRPSLLLLDFFVHALRDAPILLLGTYRELEAKEAPEVSGLLGELGRKGRCLRLRGLREGEVAELVEKLTAVRPSQSMVRALCELTEGNPFFLTEVARLATAEGAFERGEQSPLEDLQIPNQVRGAIRQRLRGLSERTRSVLSTCAVVGREFDIACVARVSGLSKLELLDVLGEAWRAGIVVEVSVPFGRYAFAHALFRETSYDDLDADRRIELHEQVGAALEDIHRANPEPHLAALAHHFFQAAQAGAVEQAIEYAKRAAAQAMSQLAYEEAADHYDRALQTLELIGGSRVEERYELLLALGRARTRAGQTEKARHALTGATELARVLGAPEKLARAALGFPQSYGGLGAIPGAVDEALIDLLEEALGALGGEDGEVRARLLARLSSEVYFSSGDERRAPLSEEAVAMARRLGDPKLLVDVLIARHFALFGPGSAKERLVIADEIVSIAMQTAGKKREFPGRVWRIVDLLEIGERDSTLAEIHALTELAAALREPRYLWITEVHRAMWALLEGRFSEAEELILCAFETTRRWYDSNAEPLFWIQTFNLRREQGRLGELESPAKFLVDRFSTPLRRSYLAFLYAEIGRTAEARAEVERLGLENFAEVPVDGNWLVTMTYLAEASALLGDAGRAKMLYDLLRPHSGENMVVGPGLFWRGPVSLPLGLLATTLPQWEDAARHFEAAIEVCTRMGARPLTARSQLGYAAMLFARGRPEDRERTLDLLARALDTARQLGMASLVEKGEVLKLSAEAGARQDGAARADEDNVFRKEGGYWAIVFEGRAFRLEHRKGLTYLAALLGHRGRELHVSELAGGTPPLTEVDMRRLTDLRHDLAEAEAFNDPGRSARARLEIEALAQELTSAGGTGARDPAAERARVNVTRAIAQALRKIADRDTELARHLRKSVKTGFFCSYAPDPDSPIDWKL